MNKTNISPATLKKLESFQQNEITEAAIYRKIAARIKDENNKNALLRIADEEERHAAIWAGYTGKVLKAEKRKVRRMSFISRLFGFTFALRKMENGEDNATQTYASIALEVPEAIRIAEDEKKHEDSLLGMLDEERLRYVGSMVLGLSDALVELSGTLAGLTFALQNTRLVALSGLITGISATLSMASSEYLSAKADSDKSEARKSATYTGIAYIITVALMIAPYLIFPSSQFLLALITMLLTVVLIIAFFSYYISVAKVESFRKRFFEMAGISLSVAAISFVIGLLVKHFLGIDV
jgi:Uncharacterized membrane protein